MGCVLGCKDGEDGWSEVVHSHSSPLLPLSPLSSPSSTLSFFLIPSPLPFLFLFPFLLLSSSSSSLILLSSSSSSLLLLSLPPPSGLKLDYSAVDMKRGKLVHVPEATYKKGCVQNVQQGMQVHFALQGSDICYFTLMLFLESIVP